MELAVKTTTPILHIFHTELKEAMILEKQCHQVNTEA
jgi:hypothetical protein